MGKCCHACGQQILGSPEDFIVAYDAYPRKKAKEAAHKAWIRQRPPLDKVLEALAWQRLEWKDKTFIPYMATWINARRWEDEPDVAPKVVPACDDALESLLDRFGVLNQYDRFQWFAGARLQGNTLIVDPESIEWISHRYLKDLSLVHGAPLQIMGG